MIGAFILVLIMGFFIVFVITIFNIALASIIQLIEWVKENFFIVVLLILFVLIIIYLTGNR